MMIVCLGALAVAAVAIRLTLGAHVVDDAYITFRYAANLAARYTFTYNPPAQVLGTTTPLWTALLAAARACGSDIPKAAVIAAGSADLAAIAVLAVASRGSVAARLGAAATIAAWPAYVACSVSGMETSVFVLLLVLAAYWVAQDRIWSASIACGLAMLCRPDAALLTLACAAVLIRRSLPAALTLVSGTALVLAPWAAYALITFGTIVPQSVTAKMSIAESIGTSLLNLRGYFLHGAYLPITMLAAPAAVYLWKSDDAMWQVLVAWAAAYTTVLAAAGGFSHFMWYYVPLLPVLVGCAAAGAARLTTLIGRQDLLRDRYVAAGAIVFVCVLATRVGPLRRMLELQESGRERLYMAVAHRLASVDPRATVAGTEIGTIGFYFPGTVVDMVGLVTPGAHVDDGWRLLAQTRPRWVVSYDTHLDRSLRADERFARAYRRTEQVPVAEHRLLEVYERRVPEPVAQ